MVIQKNHILLEVNRINEILYGSRIVEQLYGGTPIILTDKIVAAKNIGDWIKSWDFHDWMTFIDLTSTFLGVISGPFAPVFFGIATAAALADAGKYWAEGDLYMAGFVLAFSIVPFGELVKYIRKASKLGPKGTIELFKKIKLGKATKEELKLGKEIAEEFGQNSEKIAKLTTKQIVANYIQNFAKLSLKAMVQSVVLFVHLSKGVAKAGLMIGGIYYTYDELYLALNSDNLKNKKIRYNSRIQQLVRKLKLQTNVESAKQQSDEFMKQHSDIIEKNPELIVTVDPSKNSDKLDTIQNELEKKYEIQKLDLEKTPTIKEVMNGKIDPITKNKMVIKKGMRGASVNYIQKILNDLDYTNFLTDFKQGANPTDSIYGKNTETAIYLFQEDNGLPQTGIVDSKTLKSLISKLNEKGKK